MKFAGHRPVGIRQKISWPRVEQRGYDVFFAARKCLQFQRKGKKERKKVSKIERTKERKRERKSERKREIKRERKKEEIETER